MLSGNKEPFLINMDDYRSDRHVICPFGIYNNIRFVLHIDGTYSVIANQSIKERFEEYLSYHPVKSGNINEVKDYYAPQKSLNRLKEKVKKLHTGFDVVTSA